MKNRTLHSVLIAAAVLAGPFVVGCEDTVSRESTTRVKDDGTVIKKEEKVTEGADGSVTRTETKKVDRPDENKDVDVKIDVDKKD